LDWKLWDRIAEVHPLIHQLTNVVTVNDCANITLTCGASPVMADAPEEAAEMAAASDAVVINIGTLRQDQLEAMAKAGESANKRGVPVVLDPVGAGATRLRLEAVDRLLKRVRFSVIRGNSSEIGTLCGRRSGRGVDANLEDLDSHLPSFRSLAKNLQAVIAVSGPVDYVTDGEREAYVENGTPLLTRVTGTGCMLTAVIGCCLGAGIEPFHAAILSLAAVGIAGEKAEASLSETEGIGTFRIRFFDEMFRMNSNTLEQDGKVKLLEKSV
jgi:hydroxyethylthiazole kinase